MSTRDQYGTQGRARGTTTMRIGNLSCTLHMPKATTSRFDERGKENVSRLAPSGPAMAYAVDDFPACPREWHRSDPEKGVGVWFLEAKPGHMVWFDLTESGSGDSHHIAAIFSAQGINALTGQKMTPPVRLEQYVDCPLHGCRLQSNKHCPDCGFEWPDQNYLATTATSGHRFWRDGFRAQDGKTREFIFTEDVKRGVAANLIGAERIDAFGVRIFRSNEPKPRPAYRSRGFESSFDGLEESVPTLGARRSRAKGSIEVGAGALVQQEVERDPQRLDYWQTDPAATFVIYYLGGEEFAEIVGSAASGGRGGGEGFLGGTPVGNP